MKNLFLTLFALCLCILPAMADDSAIEQSTEITTQILENSITEETKSEEETVLDEQQSTQIAEDETTPRNKWDFSDRPKKKKPQEKNSGASSNNNDKEFSSPGILKDNNKTWESPTSGKKIQSTYPKIR